MEAELHVAAIAHVIQAAVAPVFLLAGVSGLLSVLTNRLGRIIDRARIIEDQLKASSGGTNEEARQRLHTFSQRARLVNASISLCTACASMVCLVIMALFAGAFVNLDLSRLIALLFIAAMISLFTALVCFLREIRIATRHLRIGTGA